MKKYNRLIERVAFAFMVLSIFFVFFALGYIREPIEEISVIETQAPDMQQEVVETVYSEMNKVEMDSIVVEETDENELVYLKSERYDDVKLNQDDIDLMAKIVYLESNTESFSGQRMVAEVILNRLVMGLWGDTVYDVIYAPGQFSTAKNVRIAEPTKNTYKAVWVALNETPITDEDVIYFATSQLNSRLFCKIGGHYFCKK